MEQPLLLTNNLYETIPQHTKARLQNTAIFGGNSTAKTAFLKKMITHDIEQNHGVILFDRNGDLYNAFRDTEREDVLIVDFSSQDVAFNPFHTPLFSTFNRVSELTLAKNAFLQFFDQIVKEVPQDNQPHFLEELIQFILENQTLSLELFFTTIEEPNFRLKMLSFLPQLTQFKKIIQTHPLLYFLRDTEHLVSLSDIVYQGGVVIFRLDDSVIDEDLFSPILTLFLHLIYTSFFNRDELSTLSRSPFFVYFNGLSGYFSDSYPLIYIQYIANCLPSLKIGSVFVFEQMSELVIENNYIPRSFMLSNCASLFSFPTEGEDFKEANKRFFNDIPDTLAPNEFFGSIHNEPYIFKTT